MTEQIARIFNVLLGRRAGVDLALTALAKRQARKGLPVLTWSWGYPVTEKERVPHPEHGWDVECMAIVTRLPLTIEGVTPHYEGWTFVAALQHLDGENIVRGVPGQSVPEVYRARGSACDHCQYNRRRNDTYVLRHDDGRHVQVGSSCISDFLGSDEAGKIASQAMILAEACALSEGAIQGSGSDREHAALAQYLPYVAWGVRSQGWVSRGAARDGAGVATADCAWIWNWERDRREKDGVCLTDEDRDLAEKAEAWTIALTDEEINAETSDYLHNLRAVARTGLTTSRTAGIAASMIVAYQRAVGRLRERASRAERYALKSHVGKIGDKVTFGLPAKVGKKGQPLKNSPIVLSLEPVTLEFVTGYTTDFGYTTVLKFRTAEGNSIVWKASSTEVTREDVGKAYTLWGTIKAHEDYKGSKQTIVTRCAVTEVQAEVRTGT